ncbi:MAG: acetylxylan esterase, partial [Bacteroidota bacterium]
IFLGLNFSGNQAIHPDPDIWMPQAWVRNDSSLGISENRATESSRGGFASRWPVETILSRGYGLATVYCSDLVPDYPSGLDEGFYPLFYRPGQTQPDSSAWGAIGAWAWGLSLTLNFLETQTDIRAHQVALIGHSRLGKTALLAGALDQRFAMVISNNSGCAGAALFRRRFGETIDAINDIAPHWFNDRFPSYRHQEDSLPVDQHQFLALIAPRPLYVGSADQDLWADPRGEYLSAYHASAIYRLYGYPALDNKKSPKSNRPLNQGRVAYHLRAGKHDLTLYDWEQYLDFADKHLR